MADVFSGSFGGGNSSTGAIAPAFRKKIDDENDPFGLAGTQSVANSNLFKQTSATAIDQMSGTAPEFDQQANIARDAQKAAQAQSAKAKRELLMGSGLRDSGAYLNQGIVQPEDQAVRERADLERRLSVDRQTLINQRQAQGQQAATNLLQFPAASIEGAKGRESTERIAFAGLNVEEKKLAMSGSQFQDEMSFKKYALSAGFDDAATQRAWQAVQNDKEIASREKISFAGLSLEENKLAQDAMQFTSRLDFDKWALTQNLDENDKQRIWEATESEKTRGFNKEMQSADQIWKTGERIGTEQANTISQRFDAEQKRLLQSRDFDGQKALANLRFNFDTRLAIQGMSIDQQNAKFAADLAEAKANKDVGREQQIITFQTSADIGKMITAGNIDGAKQKIAQDYALALQDNDAVHVAALQQTRLNMEELENEKDRALEQTRVDLAVAGVDMEKMNQTYEYLAGEVEAGRADPKTLTDFVSGVAGKAVPKVKVTAPDPMATEKAAQKKYDDMLHQYSLTHPGAVVYRATKALEWNNGKSYKVGDVIEDPATIKDLQANEPSALSRDVSPTASAKEFNEFFNSTTYGELTKEEKDAKAVAGYLTDPVDLMSSGNGDKFSFKAPVEINVARSVKEGEPYKAGTITTGDGTATLPPGKYRIETRASTTGDTFIGTKRDITSTFVIGEDGKEYLIKYDIGKTQGNIISGLWAGQ